MDKITLQCVKCNNIMRQVEARPDSTVVFSCGCGTIVSLRSQQEAPPIEWKLCDVPTIARASLGRRADDYQYLADYDAGMSPPIRTAELPPWRFEGLPPLDVLEGDD